MDKWTIDKDELLNAAAVMDLVPVRPGIPSSEFFRMEPVKNGSIRLSVASEVAADVLLKGSGVSPFKGAFYLDRRVFLPFVFAAKERKSDKPFVFTGRPSKQLTVHHGKRIARFSSQQEVTGYNNPPHAELVAKLDLSDKLRSLIHCARECATADPVTPQLNCVYVKPRGHIVNVYATNQKILFRAQSKTKLVHKQAIPFPLYLVHLLSSDQLKEVHWKKKYASLKFRHGRVWQSVSVKARKAFPVDAIEKYMVDGQKSSVMFQLSSKRFAKVLLQMCSYLASVRRQDWTLEMFCEKGSNRLNVKSTVPQCMFKESVKLDRAAKETLSLVWPLDMLEPVFQFLATRKDVTLEVRTDKKGRSHVHAGDVELVIPRRSE